MHDLPLPDNFLATPHRFLWHTPTATAILSDLHLGAEAELTRRGLMMPDLSTRALRAAWAQMCARLAAAQGESHLIIAGDLFDVPTPDAAAIILATELLSALPEKCRLTIIPGNHDPAPDALHRIFQGIPLTIADAVTVGGYTVIHGHHALDTTANGRPLALILGHQHPAVMVGNRVQSVKMTCYATGTTNGIPFILLPAFSHAPLGSTLSDRHWMLNFPWPGDSGLRIAGIVVRAKGGGGVFDFGTLAGLRLPF